MAKFRMKYRPPVEGVKITVSDATYQRLKLATATNLHLIPPRARTPIKSAIGCWCESHLWTALEHGQLYPLPKPQIEPLPNGKTHTVEIGEHLHMGIERFVKDKGRTANHWIAATVLKALAIEEERQRGAKLEADRFG